MKAYEGFLHTPDAGEVGGMKPLRWYHASDVDARVDALEDKVVDLALEIARLRDALRQIATGAAVEYDGLTYEEIAAIASKSLMER
jgi:DNA-directed RNA polymerase specialized sigma24 family protein